MRVDPVFKKQMFKVESDLCFVLMPFRKELEAVYSDHIKKVMNSLNMKCVRADDLFSNSVIIDDIWDLINRARLVIADLTNKNPNVFYEIGLAHVVGRPVVLITQSIDDIPFDLRHLRNIVYEYTPRGMQKFEESLQNTLKYILDQPNTSIEQFRQELVSDTFPGSPNLSNFTDEYVLSFVSDRVNEIPFREKALEVCFSRGIIEQSFIDVLNRENNDTLKKTIAKLVEKYQFPISKELLIALMQGERSVAIAAVGAAYSLSKSGNFTSDILQHVNSHPSWEVQRKAVERIIELDDTDSLNTLAGFLKLDYHISVDFVRRYIERVKSEGRFANGSRTSVVAFLNRYINEERFSDITKANLTRTLNTIEGNMSAG